MHHFDNCNSALVVEDDEHVRYLLEHMLRREGFAVTALGDGREAAEHIASQGRSDIAILDVMLPYLDGFELAQLIRAHPKWQSVPIIILSGRSQADDIARALEAGANDYVCKPFSPREFLARVRLRLSEARETAAY